MAVAFTEAEIEQWHADRRTEGEADDDLLEQLVCGHCGNPFNMCEVAISEDFVVCDVCNGD